jgi:hypothetical protein
MLQFPTLDFRNEKRVSGTYKVSSSYSFIKTLELPELPEPDDYDYDRRRKDRIQVDCTVL